MILMTTKGSPQHNLLETADQFPPADRAAGPWQAETALADESGLFVDPLEAAGAPIYTLCRGWQDRFAKRASVPSTCARKPKYPAR
jgi:hypothetical protein